MSHERYKRALVRFDDYVGSGGTVGGGVSVNGGVGVGVGVNVELHGIGMKRWFSVLPPNAPPTIRFSRARSSIR